MTQLFTKLHEALAAPTDQERRMAHTLLAVFGENAPHYVLSRDLLPETPEAIAALFTSLAALFEMNMARLPFPSILIEVWSGEPWRHFIGVTQDDARYFSLLLFTWNSAINLSPLVLEASLLWEPDTVEQWRTLSKTLDVSGFSIRTSGPDDPEERKRHRKAWGIVEIDAMSAVAMMLLMRNIGGVEREMVEAPEKLNKHRRAQGKPEIRTHTVVRIGHVYDREGRKVSVPTGRHMPVHLRAAHVRMQPHGAPWRAEHPELADLPGNTETHHKVLIDAILVNYQDGDEVPLPLPKLVRA